MSNKQKKKTKVLMTFASNTYHICSTAVLRNLRFFFFHRGLCKGFLSKTIWWNQGHLRRWSSWGHEFETQRRRRGGGPPPAPLQSWGRNRSLGKKCEPIANDNTAEAVTWLRRESANHQLVNSRRCRRPGAGRRSTTSRKKGYFFKGKECSVKTKHPF